MLQMLRRLLDTYQSFCILQLFAGDCLPLQYCALLTLFLGALYAVSSVKHAFSIRLAGWAT